MKKKIIFSFLFVSLFSGWFFLNPKESMAACEFKVDPVYACYNSKRVVGMDRWGGTCYDGNWRIRGTVSNIGNTIGSGYYQLTGASKLLKHVDFTLAPGARRDTNDTIRLTLCGTNQIMFMSSCAGDTYPLNNYWFALPAGNIPRCQ